jgi:hypothetical protein
MKQPKKPVAFRLSETTIKQLTEISGRQKVSQADVISILVHLYYMFDTIENIDEWFDVARIS